MAERRMFAKTIIDSDAFLDMPLSSQALYFHLSMRADDDGFINNPKKIMRMVGTSEDDMRLLIAKNFIIPFETGVVVIKHWKIHNYIQKDRYKETLCQSEKKQLVTEKNNEYTKCIQDVYNSDTQVRLGKDSLGKDSLGYNASDEAEATKPAKPKKHKHGEFNNVLLTDEEVEKLKQRFPYDWDKKIEKLSQGLALKGYKYKSHYLAILKWAENEKPTDTRNVYDESKYRVVSEDDDIGFC